MWVYSLNTKRHPPQQFLTTKKSRSMKYAWKSSTLKPTEMFCLPPSKRKRLMPSALSGAGGRGARGSAELSCDGLPSSRLNLGPACGTGTPRMSWVASPQNNVGSGSNTSLMPRVQMCVSMSERKVSLTELKRGCWFLSYIPPPTLMMLLYEAVMYVTAVKGTRLSDSKRFALHNNNHK